MAKTQLHNYSVQEKLNKMDIDMIDIEATLSTSGAEGSVMFLHTEIPDCVAVKGGTALLHSVTAIVADNATDTSSNGVDCLSGFRLIFTSDSSITNLALQDVLATEGTATGSGGFQATRAQLATVNAVVAISGAQDAGYFGLHYVSNCGAVLKAASDTTSMYVFGVSGDNTNYAGGKITLRIGVIKD